MNEIEAHRIAAALNQLRPDWPVSSLKTLLAKPMLANRHRRDVAVALTWVACDSASKTPARVLEAGPWWTATAEAGGNTAPRPPRREEACTVCGKRDEDHRADYDHPFSRHSPRAVPDEAVLAGARADLAAAKAAVRVDPRPHVPPEPEQPAERVQGDVSEEG